MSYSTRPLQIFGLLGLVAGGLGTLITGWLGYVRLFEHQAIGDRPLLLLGMMLVFIGVQLVTFGLLAELLARTYYESQNKPTYVIREIRQTAELATVDELMPPAAPREHDPRITVIQQELFDETRSSADKYRDLVIGRPGLWPLLAVRARDDRWPAGCPARSACSCARSSIR